MKLILLVFVFVINLFQLVNAQVITCVPCEQLGMVINVGSQETSISIYHSGQYMTHPQSENIFIWEFKVFKRAVPNTLKDVGLMWVAQSKIIIV